MHPISSNSDIIESVLKESRLEIPKDVGDVMGGIKQVLNMQNLSNENLISRKKIMWKKSPRSDTLVVKLPPRDKRKREIRDIVKKLRTRNNITVEFIS